MHADAIIAIAAARNGERLTHEIFGGDIGWIDWMRPGFELGLRCERLIDARPSMKGLVLGSHGLVTWDDDPQVCYETTLRVIQQAADWLDSHSRPDPFGATVTPALGPDDRRAFVAAFAPLARRLLSAHVPKVLHYSDDPAILAFVGSARAEALAALGTTCPDHFLRTKVKPLFVPFSPGADTPEAVGARLDTLVDRYRADYTAYYERCKRPDSPALRDPYPVLLIVPGIGLLSFQKDKQTARVAAEFYLNTINVMRWAEGVDAYVPIPEQDAFDIEYWVLEEAKLQRLPKPKALEGRIAVVTGGAGGIGRAVSSRLLAEGANVVLLDIDQAVLDEATASLAARAGRDRVRGVCCDVTDEASVAAAFDALAREYGGLDILVSNAGIASASPVEDTSLEVWQRTVDILATGYFLVSREAFRLMKRQGRGGSHRVRRQQERARRLAWSGGLLRRQGGGPAPRALSGR